MLLRLISWTVLKIGKQTLILWTLLSLVLGSLVFGLADLVRGLDLQLMISISLIGMLAGWLFARTRMSGPAAALLSIALGVAMILIRIGRLGGPLVRLVFALNEMVAGYLNWRPLLPFPVSMTARLGLLELWNSIAAMFVHIRDWAAALGSSSAFDPVATNLVWNFAIWSIAVWAAWAIRKLERPLPAVTPAGVLLAASLAFTRESTGLLLLVLPATFILMAWVHYRVQERRWETSQVDYSEDIRLDLGIVVCVLTTLLVLAAAYSPIFSIRRIIDFTSRLARPADNLSQPIGRSLGLEPGRSPVEHSSLADMRSGGLPRDHLLGSGPELSRDVVMLIHTGDIPPGPPEMVLRRPLPRYYWRSITYDRYTGRGWATGPTETIAYRADQPALATDLPARRLVNQTVEFMGALAGDFQDRLLYTAGELVSVDQDYQVAWRTRSAGKETASEGDVFGATTTAKKYQADSLVSMPTQDQLRSAGQEYPEWVRSRFLALPEDLPSRVLSLARDLAATNPTPYDRALAIEAHLRSYTYNLELPAPPSNRDIVDYFLFDIKEGYCDYYATAMVVLSRAAGIPARMAIGYASGSYDAYNARYVVTEAEAHSWPEIYFPGYGWVIFEPTAGQPPLDRQGEAGLLSTPGLESGGPTPAFRLPVAWPRILGWAGLLVAISALLAVSWVLSEHWRLGKLSPSGTIAVLYGRIYRRGRGLEVPATAGSTPYEFATLFSERLIELGHNKNREQVLLPAAREVHQIADLYAQAIYSQHAPCTSQQQQAIQIWQRLRWRLWLAKLGGQDRKQS